MKKMKIIPLSKVSPNPLSGGVGIIEKLQSFNPPWASLNISQLLDIYYYGNHSGNKIISPMIENILGDNDTLTDEQQTTIANIIFSLFNKNWARMWEVYNAEYEPAENYNMIENGADGSTILHGETITRTDNLNYTKTGTETDTPNITETNTPNTTRTINNGIYGFNSDTSQPSDSGTETNTGTETIQRTGTDQTQYNINEGNTGTQTHAHTGTDTENKTHQLTRHGNIGVTTTQQMLQSEIDLWQWEFFNNVLFPNIDGVMTIQVY